MHVLCGGRNGTSATILKVINTKTRSVVTTVSLSQFRATRKSDVLMFLDTGSCYTLKGLISHIQITTSFIHIASDECLCSWKHYGVSTAAELPTKIGKAEFICSVPFKRRGLIKSMVAMENALYLAVDKASSPNITKASWLIWLPLEANDKLIHTLTQPMFPVTMEIFELGKVKTGYLFGMEWEKGKWATGGSYVFIPSMSPNVFIIHGGCTLNLPQNVASIQAFVGTTEVAGVTSVWKTITHRVYLALGTEAGRVELYQLDMIKVTTATNPLVAARCYLFKRDTLHGGRVSGIVASEITYNSPIQHKSLNFISVSLDGTSFVRSLNQRNVPPSRITTVAWPSKIVTKQGDVFTAFGYTAGTSSPPSLPKLIVPFAGGLGLITITDVTMHAATVSTDCRTATSCDVTPLAKTDGVQQCSAVSANGLVSVVFRFDKGTTTGSLTLVRTSTKTVLQEDVRLDSDWKFMTCNAIGISPDGAFVILQMTTKTIKNGFFDVVGAFVSGNIFADDFEGPERTEVRIFKIDFDASLRKVAEQSQPKDNHPFLSGIAKSISFTDAALIQPPTDLYSRPLSLQMTYTVMMVSSEKIMLGYLGIESLKISGAKVIFYGPTNGACISQNGRFAVVITPTNLVWYDFSTTDNSRRDIMLCTSVLEDGCFTSDDIASFEFAVISSDSSKLAIGSSKMVSLFDVDLIVANTDNQNIVMAAYQQYLIPTGSNKIVHLAISSDGKYVAVGTQSTQYQILEWNVEDMIEIMFTKARPPNDRYGDIMETGDSGNVMFFDKKGKSIDQFSNRLPWEKLWSNFEANAKMSLTLIFQQTLLIGVADPTGNILSISFGGPYMSLSFGVLLEAEINKPKKTPLPTLTEAEKRDAQEREKVLAEKDIPEFITLVISLSAKMSFDVGLGLIIKFRIGRITFTVYDSTLIQPEAFKVSLWSLGGPVEGLILRYQFLIPKPATAANNFQISFLENYFLCPVNARYGGDKKYFPTFDSRLGPKTWNDQCTGTQGEIKVCEWCKAKVKWQTWKPVARRREVHQLEVSNSSTNSATIITPASSDVYTGVCDAESFKYFFELRFREHDRVQLDITISLGNVVAQIGERSCQVKAFYRVKGAWTGIVDLIRIPTPQLEKDACWMQPVPQLIRATATDAGDHIGLWIHYNSMLCADIHLRYGLESILEDNDFLLSEQTMQSDPPMSQLIIHADGNLVLYGYESDAVIWESKTAQPGAKTVSSKLRLNNGAVVLENTVAGVTTSKILNPNSPIGGKFLLLRECDLQLYEDSTLRTSLWNLTNQPCPTASEVRTSPRWHRGGSYLYLGESLLQNSGLMNGNGYFQHERGAVHFVRLSTLEKLWTLTDETILNVRTSAFTLQWDGNLVLHDYSGNIVWESKTGGLGATVLRLERCGIALYKQAPNIG
eukprot:PhF_6_TR44117/c0_g1_i3/m.67330